MNSMGYWVRLQIFYAFSWSPFAWCPSALGWTFAFRGPVQGLGSVEQLGPTVDGSEIQRSPVEVGSLSHYLQGFMHARWLFRFLNHQRCHQFSMELWGNGRKQMGNLGEITLIMWSGGPRLHVTIMIPIIPINPLNPQGNFAVCIYLYYIYIIYIYTYVCNIHSGAISGFMQPWSQTCLSDTKRDADWGKDCGGRLAARET